MKQLKRSYKALLALGIIAFLLIIVFLGVGVIGGNNALFIPWSATVEGTTSNFGILHISYRCFLNVFFAFGKSGWTWDFTRIFIAAAFWASVLLVIIGIIVAACKEKKAIAPVIFIFLSACMILWVIEGVTFARTIENCMTTRYALSFAVVIALALISIILLLIAISFANQMSAVTEEEKEEAKEAEASKEVTDLENRVAVLEGKVEDLIKRQYIVITAPVAAAPVQAAPVAAAPVEEEKPVEAPVEEKPVEAAPVEESKATLNIKRIPFSEKYAAADEDLKAKFDELSAYITDNYGIKARESIAGVSFSAHREKLVFATFIGKHLRCNFALDAKNYSDSTIPVVNSDNKKYADVPLTLKVKSGLSLRRACSLVDDVMAAKGIKKISK